MRHRLATALLTAALGSAAAAQTSFPNLVYATVPNGTGALDLRLDLQVPAGAGPFPLVVWIHGGGWVGGSRSPIPGLVTRLLPRGYAVASIDYRLSGTAIWPAQIHDCKAAIRYLRANAATWGIDPNRLAVMGSSAGGHLVAALATMGDVGTVRSGSVVLDLEGAVGAHLGTSSRVQAAVDQFGPTNMLHAQDLPTFDHNGATSPESRLIGGPLQDNPATWATVDPIPFLTPDDAPILAMHGTDDTTVPFHQSQLLVEAARAIGHDTTLFPVQDNGHGGPGFTSAEATTLVDTFLDRTLRDLPTTTVSVQVTDAQAHENGDPAAFVVTRTGSTVEPLVVSLGWSGEVLAGADCTPLPLLVTIPAGSTSAPITLVPLDDSLVEGNERAVLHVAPGSYRIAASASHAIATLLDDDAATGLPVVTLLTVDAVATEAAGNPGALRFVRTGSTAAPLVVAYEVVGTATNGSDYQPLSGTATIAAGSPGALVVVQTLQDQEPEAGETVVLRLLPAAHYARGTAPTAHVVIADDDRAGTLPIVGALTTEVTLGEPADAAHVTFTRTGAVTQPLVVRYQVAGTATPGSDYAMLPGLATIPAGAQWVRVPVLPLDDVVAEPVEALQVILAPDAAYRIGRAARLSLDLVDDDAMLPANSPLAFAVGPLAVGQAGQATVAGGLAGGYVAVWIGLQPGHLPVPPFGTFLLDAVWSGPFATGVLDAGGAATLALVIPPWPALVGMPTWWQGFASLAGDPFAAITRVHERTLLGPAPF